MALTVGARLGPYEIQSAIGAGGMGEVYKARDTRLDRLVAIKVLPAHVASDPDLKQRFEREARTLAALSHPHICPMFDVGHQEGIDFLVMEYLEGETLATRLERGALALDQAIQYAIQIADALDKAHRKGIVHRDLKPGNVMLTRSGVKLLDFGLAKQQPAGVVSGSSVAVTMASPLTGQGMILGTLHYMAPEQVEGKDADARSDIFSFGAIVFEMTTGKRAFEGTSAASVMAKILEHDPPPMSTPQRITPPALDRVVRKCLAKDPEARWHSAHDLHDELRWIAEAPSPVAGGSPATRRRGGERLAWGAALTVVTVIAAALGFRALRPAPALAELRLEITAPPTTDPTSLAISPDGTWVAFAATVEGQSRLFLRSLSSGSTRTLPGTEGAQYLFWSPDSRSIGFLGENRLKRIDIDSGSVQALVNAPGMRGGAWNRDGVILFARSTGSSIHQVSATTGGEGTPVLQLQLPKQANHRFPQFLPDGRHFLYYVQGTPEARGVYVGQLDGLETRRVLDADAAAVYSVGQLLFVQQGTLFAQAFDPVGLSLTGAPSPLAEHVTVDAANNLAALSASAVGPIVYRTGGRAAERQFAWFDRSGKEIERVGSPDTAAPTDPSMSPDGRRLALFRTSDGNRDIWLIDLARGVLTRFASDVAGDVSPIWSSDGTRVVFSSHRNRTDGVFDLYQRPTVGAGNEERLLTTGETMVATDWSSDGRFLLYRSLSRKTGWDIWALPVAGDGKHFPVVQTNFEERDAQFSPDGKWIAYQSIETGRVEIYVQSFPAGARTQISTTGGAQVRWRRDGKELFYIALDGRLMAVPVELPANGQTVEPGRPVALFETHIGGAVQGFNKQQYVVSSDGQRFLMNVSPDEASTAPITVLVNWTVGMKK
jgi:Tol biopolymer transport system component/predicted Ser/Thr protein kinase